MLAPQKKKTPQLQILSEYPKIPHPEQNSTFGLSWEITRIIASIGEPFVEVLRGEGSVSPKRKFLRTKGAKVGPRTVSDTTELYNNFRLGLDKARQVLGREGLQNHVIEIVRRILHALELPSKGIVEIQGIYLKECKQSLEREKKSRKGLVYYLDDVRCPPVPLHLQEKMRTDCQSALIKIDKALQKVKKAQALYVKIDNRHSGRRPTTLTETKKKLMEFFIETLNWSTRKSAKITAELLNAFRIPNRTFDSENIRLNYQNRKRVLSSSLK